MQTSFISSRTLRAAPRIDLAEHQAGLARASREIATGRHDDAGRVLGARTGLAVDLRFEDTRLSGLVTTNGLVDARMDQTQRVLDGIRSRADGLLRSVTALPPSSTAVTSLVLEARDALEDLLSKLNASDGGAYLFAGIDVGDRPLEDLSGPPAAAIDAALTAAFGAPAVPPGTTPAQMAAFLAGDFAAVFDPAGWTTSWSGASDVPVSAEIERGRIVDVSVTANEATFRDLAMVYAMLSELDIGALRSDTRQVVIDTALATLGRSVTGVVELQGRLGLVQQTVDEATARLQAEVTIARGRLAVLEGVDPGEAKTRADMLATQIEMSYALTVRLARLSILDFA